MNRAKTLRTSERIKEDCVIDTCRLHKQALYCLWNSPSALSGYHRSASRRVRRVLLFLFQFPIIESPTFHDPIFHSYYNFKNFASYEWHHLVHSGPYLFRFKSPMTHSWALDLAVFIITRPISTLFLEPHAQDDATNLWARRVQGCSSAIPWWRYAYAGHSRRRSCCEQWEQSCER